VSFASFDLEKTKPARDREGPCDDAETDGRTTIRGREEKRNPFRRGVRKTSYDTKKDS
jgi:hypothetical protein